MDIEIMPREPASAKLHRIAQKIMELAVNAEKLERMGLDVEIAGDLVLHQVQNVRERSTRIDITSNVRILAGN